MSTPKKFTLMKWLMACSAVVITAAMLMSFQDSAGKKANKTDCAQYAQNIDTVPDKTSGSVEKAMKQLGESMDQVGKELSKINWEDIGRQVRDAIKAVDVDKIMNEVRSALKEVDMKKMEKELQQELKKIDFKEVEAEIENAMKEFRSINWSEVEAGLKKEKKEMSEEDKKKMEQELEKLKPELEKKMQQLKEQMKKLKEELKKDTKSGYACCEKPCAEASPANIIEGSIQAGDFQTFGPLSGDGSGR